MKLIIKYVKKGSLHELLQEKMNSKENQVFFLLLTEYIFSKKLQSKKQKKRSVRFKPWLKIRMYTSAFNNIFAELMVNDKKEFLR